MSQIITTYGPGSLLDLPRHSVIVAGLDTWKPNDLEQIIEPRLTAKIRKMTNVGAPELRSPPPMLDIFRAKSKPSYIGVRQFPSWFVVRTPESRDKLPKGKKNVVSRRLVHLQELEGGRYQRKPVVATRFVRACPKGHVDDINWRLFVHKGKTCFGGQLWLDERGQSGDLADLFVRCGACRAQRAIAEAGDWHGNPLGKCSGKRPWLGKYASEECVLPSRLMIRTASNAYFSHVVRVLSIPDSGKPVRRAVRKKWEIFQGVDIPETLNQIVVLPDVRKITDKYGTASTFKAIQAEKGEGADERSPKEVEMEAFLAAKEGFDEDVPVNRDYHARRLHRSYWSSTELTQGIEAVVQLHRLREVSALVGFTRLEAALPDIDGEYESDVSRADLDENPSWFPAVENRGEGIFLSLDPDAVAGWLKRPKVAERVAKLKEGHSRWLQSRNKEFPEFPGGPYILLHTLSHLLMQAMSLRCGYPGTAIRERIYRSRAGDPRYGLLIYTASPDADGTLGGLVQQAHRLEEHLATALQAAELCSSDPICSQHPPGGSLDEPRLHGAACHSCSLVAETSCEVHNEYLDRALVVPTVDEPNAAFFERPA